MHNYYFNNLKSKLENIWWNCNTSYDNFNNLYLKKNDTKLLEIADLLSDNSKDENDVFSTIKLFLKETLNISTGTLEILLKKEFVKYSRDFIRKAKIVDSSLKSESIFQGLRNVWTMHSMQIFFNKKVELTNSIFAYSMLYPLTDNLLDSLKYSKDEKLEFNKRFYNKIKFGSSEIILPEEKNIYKMIDIIESDWERKLYPKVYESLLGILDAQNLSILQHNNPSIYSNDILGITFYKGGTSVLADAHLIKGNLSEEEMLFSYYYGVILQLADDLQDISDDKSAGHSTIMTIESKHNNLDEILCKLLNIIDTFLNDYFDVSTENRNALKEMTTHTIKLLIFAALQKNKRYLGKEILNKVTMNSIFSIKAYKKSEKIFYKKLKSLAN